MQININVKKLNLIIIREMRIKVALRGLFSPFRLAKIPKSGNTFCL